MKPYYEHAGVTIYHADCREVLPDLTADLIVTDPPYNAGKDYGEGTNDKRTWAEYCEWIVPIIEMCECSSSGLVMMFLSVNGLLELSQVKRPRHVCVWEKPMSFAPRMGGSPFLPHWEPCAIYGKPWGEGGRVPAYHMSDVWRHNPAEKNGHPCPKPLSLMTRIISKIPADLLCDPFCGSGTTLVAAKELGRRAVGIELNEEYCEIAAKRLAQEVLDLT